MATEQTRSLSAGVDAAGPKRDTPPDVAVVVAVHNGMPEVTRAVLSVLRQSVDPARLELIVVDDGSTDGTPTELERLRAGSQGRMRVVAQPPSGGPSRPRNVGLGLARARYVFFLDADDHLGLEALERLVSMADQYESDVVLGRLIGPDGGSPSVFAHDEPDANLYTSRVKWTLSAQKLFRRSVLEAEPAIRFPEDLWTGEDAVFSMAALLRARRISVLASYPCYHRERRAGGSHVTQRPGVEPRLRAIARLMEVIARSTEPGRRRDELMIRPFRSGLRGYAARRFLGLSDDDRDVVVRLGGPLVRQWFTLAVAGRIPVRDRVALHLVGLGRREALERFLEISRTQAPDLSVGRDGARAIWPVEVELGSLPSAAFDLPGRRAAAYRLRAVEWVPPVLRVRGDTRIRARRGRPTLGLALLDSARDHSTAWPVEVRQRKEDTRADGIVVWEYEASVDVARLVGESTVPATWDAYLLRNDAEVSEYVRLAEHDTPVALASRITLELPAGAGRTRRIQVQPTLSWWRRQLSIHVGRQSTPLAAARGVFGGMTRLRNATARAVGRHRGRTSRSR